MGLHGVVLKQKNKFTFPFFYRMHHLKRDRDNNHVVGHRKVITSFFSVGSPNFGINVTLVARLLLWPDV
jgi:hypothetical protein